MKTKSIVWLMGASALCIGVLQTIAVKFYLYWTIWWFDIIMHFLGGFWIALIILWFYKAFVGVKVRNDHGYLVSIIGTILVGVLWEVYEVITGLTRGQDAYVFDTSLDLIMDTCGALFATYIVFRKSLQTNTTTQ